MGWVNLAVPAGREREPCATSMPWFAEGVWLVRVHDEEAPGICREGYEEAPPELQVLIDPAVPATVQHLYT
jgi:hypothetical protein